MENTWSTYKDQPFWGEYQKVITRSGFKCEECGSPDNLVFHHLDGVGFNDVKFGAANNSPENVRLLCRKCHAKAHGFTDSGRRELARELRVSGYTFEMIGRELGVSRQRAHQLVGLVGYGKSLTRFVKCGKFDTMNKHRQAFYLNDNLKSRIEEYQKLTGISKSELFRRAIVFFLDSKSDGDWNSFRRGVIKK